MLPAKYQKLFLQCIFDEKQHPSAAAYLDVDRVMLFDMLFSLHSLQLYQQEAQASIHCQAKAPIVMMIANVNKSCELQELSSKYHLRHIKMFIFVDKQEKHLDILHKIGFEILLTYCNVDSRERMFPCFPLDH